MIAPNEKHIRLSVSQHQTESSVKIKKDGTLIVELCDFSEATKDHFGDAVDFLLVVSASDRQQVLAGLMEAEGAATEHTDPDTLLLQLMQEQFPDYHAVKQWLDERRIPYKKAIYYGT